MSLETLCQTRQATNMSCLPAFLTLDDDTTGVLLRRDKYTSPPDFTDISTRSTTNRWRN